ncbi:lipoprotein [Paucimonas lemoignei]|nr:lipoprotein [Paucimonas lemoignei]
MNKHKKLVLGKLACAICLVISGGVFAEQQTLTAPVASNNNTASVMEIPGIYNLPDKFNHDHRTLDLNAPVHIHKFTAIRGQDVFVKVANAQGLRVERLEGQVWKSVSASGDMVRNLSPGNEVIVSVSYAGLPEPGGVTYEMMMGSAPVLKDYNLWDESGVKRIPPMDTPMYFTTQAYTKAQLFVKFTDSKDFPLEGAQAKFYLTYGDKSPRPAVELKYFSDSGGSIVRTVNLGACRSSYATEFSEFSGGYVNTWRSFYLMAGYRVFNEYLNDAGTNFRYLGHVCRHDLVRSVSDKVRS